MQPPADKEPGFEVDDSQSATWSAWLETALQLMQQSQWAAAIGYAELIATAGEPRFAHLTEHCRGQVFEALSFVAWSRKSLCERRGAVQANDRLTALGRPVFHSLSSGCRQSVLQAYALNAILHADGQEDDAAQTSIEIGIELGYPVFAELNNGGKLQVLQMMLGQSKFFRHGVAGELSGYESLLALAVKLYSNSDPQCRYIILQALLNRALLLNDEYGDPNGAKASYDEAVAIAGDPDSFGDLNGLGQAVVLQALIEEPYLFARKGDAPESIPRYEQAIALGAPRFASLTAAGRGSTLRAIVNLAIIHGQAGDIDREMQLYNQAASLGEPVFSTLDVMGRRMVLTALFNQGVTWMVGEPVSAMASFKLAIERGVPVFEELNSKGRRQVLMALANRSALRTAHGDVNGARLDLDLMIELGERSVASLDAAAASALTRAFCMRLRSGTPSREQALTCARVLRCAALQELQTTDSAGFGTAVPAIAHGGFGPDEAGVLQASLRLLSSQELASLSWSEARRWLLMFARSDYSMSRPTQRRALVSLATSIAVGDWSFVRRLAERPWLAALETCKIAALRRVIRSEVDRHWQSVEGTAVGVLEDGAALRTAVQQKSWWWRLKHRKPLRTCADLLDRLPALELSDHIDAVSRAIASALTHVAAERLGLEQHFRDAGQVLLAFLRARVAPNDTTAWWSDPPWLSATPDELATSLNIALAKRTPPDGVDLGSWFFQGISRPVYATLDDSGEIAAEFAELMLALHNGDAEPARRAMSHARWTLLGNQPHSVPVRLHQLLKSWGDSVPLALASDALLFAEAPQVLTSRVRSHVGATLRAAAELPEAMGKLLDRLIADLSYWDLQSEVFQILHDALAIDAAAIRGDAAALWSTLETARFALASSSPALGDCLAPDAKASAALSATYKAGIVDFRNRSAHVADGLPDYHVAIDGCDATIAHLDVITQEAARLGHRLQIPTPAECAARLQPHDRLVQLWFDAEGRLCMLELQPDGSLASQALAGLDRPSWQSLLELWSNLSSTTQRLDNFLEQSHAAWLHFSLPSGNAVTLLNLLSRSQRGIGERSAGQTIWIAPGELACLPWLALATAHGSPNCNATDDDVPAAIRLESSVSAWRYAKPSTADQTPDLTDAGIARVFADLGDAYGEADGRQAAYCLGAAALEAAKTTSLDLMLALQHSGPKHLALHGIFDPSDSSASRLNINASLAIPTWWISMVNVRGDISLSVCDAMMSATSPKRPWLGPVGIGPLLRARGASSVVGPLWAITKIASLMFYAHWFNARKTAEPMQALARAQLAMRTVPSAQAAAMLRQIAPALAGEIDSYVDSTVRRNWKTPFDHPGLWASFSLLGG